MNYLRDRFSGIEIAGYVLLAAVIAMPFSCWRLSPEETEILEMWYLGKPVVFPLHRQNALDFEKLHPGVRLKTATTSGARSFIKVLPSMQAGTCADVLNIHWTSMSEFAPKGVLLPLDDLAERDGYDLDDFFPASLNTYSYKGKLYGIPFMGSTMALFYKKDSFDAAGLDYPNEEWTWDDVLEAAKKLTIVEDGRMVQVGLNPYDCASWVWSGGGGFSDEDVSELYFTKPETISALQFYLDLRNKHCVAPKNMDKMGQDPLGLNVFENGRVAMNIAGPFSFSRYKEITSFEWGVTLFPKGPGGRQTRYAGTCFAIWEGCENKELAWEFVKFICGKKQLAMFAETGLDVPARRSVAYSEAYLRPEYTERWDMEIFLRSQEPEYATVRTFSRSPLWPKVEVYFDENLDRALIEETTIEEAMADTERKAREYIKDAMSSEAKSEKAFLNN
jgi:multiple sugar transport system substrate-binding protein